MSKTVKRLSLGFVFVAVVSMLMMLVAVADYSGTDTNIAWTFDTSDGTLTVDGTGAMPTYEFGKAPWYQYGSQVKEIIVTSNVTSISKGAFYGMEGVEKISLAYVGSGSGVTHFGYIFGADNYFRNNEYIPTSLKTVEITGSTTIGSYAFNNASGIEKVVLADTVTTIDTYAFKDCASLKTMVFGSGTKTINANAFLRCTELKNLLYNGTSTGWSAVSVNSTNKISPVFLSGNAFTVTAPEKTVYQLGEPLDLAGFAAYLSTSDVTDMVEVVTPDMTTIGSKAVSVVLGTKTASFNIVVESAGLADVSGIATWSLSDDGTLTVSGEGMMDNYTLETLAPWYSLRDTITAVVVEEGITSVGAYAFYGLENVISVTLPASVELVDYAAFEGCSSLAEFTLTNAQAVVDGTAFNDCSSLVVTVGTAKYIAISGNSNYALVSIDPSATSFTIPATTAVIADGAFENSALTSIVIPDSVISIGDNAFASSAALQSVTLGAGVKHIGNYAFVDCSSLATLNITAAPDFVGAGAFAATALTGTTENGAVYLGNSSNPYMILWKAENTDITTCTLNANTKVIASLAFANCTALEAVQLPEGLVHIGDSAFNGCSALYVANLPGTVVSIGDAAFKDCSALSEVNFSDSLEVIGNSAFRGASALKSVIIGAGVENVGYNAFRDCISLREVIFSASSGIGYKTFAGCMLLNDVYLADSVASIGEYAFKDCTALAAIAIPDTTASIGFGAFYGCTAINELAVPFVGEKANGTSASYSYLFGGVGAPTAFNKVLVGSAIPADAFSGVTAINTLILDKTVTSIGESAFDANIANVFYLGSAEEWATVAGAEALSNVAFANSEFDLTSKLSSYEVGDVLDRANFTATLGAVDVTSLLRFRANPVTDGEALKLPAKLGSLVQGFRAKDIDDISFTNYSLLLEGSIGVKFYVKLSEFAIEKLDEITATVHYFGEDYNVELLKAENTVDGAIYTVKFYVAAKEMMQPVKLTISTPEETKTITRSVKDYVEYVNKNADDYADCIELINEMYNYGEYSKYFFENSAITPNPDLENVEVVIPNAYTPTKAGTIDGIELTGTSLLLESKTTVRHYFKLADSSAIDDYTFTVNGKTVQPVQKDEQYYIDIENIIAKDLGVMQKLKVSDASQTMTIKYSPVSYAKIVLENHTETPRFATLAKALYRYYLAAYDYFADAMGEITPDEDESKPSIW